jgi:tetratricopeptide (TPR) repeat protein/DNA-binding XRE family transcriptional regulator
LRADAGLTQEELAGRARLGVTTVSELERGRHATCHRPTARQLAEALGLPGPVRPLFVAVARGLTPPANVLTAMSAAAQPGSGQPGAAQPGSGQPGAAQPGSGQPGSDGTPVAGAADPGMTGTPAGDTLEVRYSLPPDAAAFTGREQEFDAITTGVTGHGGVVAIHAIDGMPGVGKTALAVHVAHRLQDRFPDRQLFVDLHGHTPGQDPVPAEAALAGLLSATGVDARYLPDGVDSRAGLWRDRMAGQRAVLVLDNAESSSQVAPLLPGGENCLVLVTSRRHLGDLPGRVVPVPVEVLPSQQAQEMFLRLAPGTAPGSDVAGLVELAGYLPLAISLLARVHARHPSWTLGDLMAETRSRMLTMAAENNSVAAVFELSYRYLTPRSQQFLRRLGLHMGVTIDAYAAAALAGTSPEEADTHLDSLHQEGLLIEVGYRRYSMHDLIRRYAAERSAADPAPSRDQARERLLAYYTHTATLAGARLTRQPRAAQPRAAQPRAAQPRATDAARPDAAQPTGADPSAGAAVAPDLPDSASALVWARAERANLLGCLDHVTETGQQAWIVALTAAVAALLQQDGPWAEAVIRHTAAVHAAGQIGDQPGLAGALSDLGVVRCITGNHQQAAAALDQALTIYRDLGDDLGRANTLSELGVVRRITGDYPQAAAVMDEALAIYRDLGDRLGQARVLSDLGALNRMMGQLAEAPPPLDEALAIYRDLGHRLGEAGALNYLGVVRRITGQYEPAATALREALAIYREVGDRLGEANALSDLAEAWRIMGNYPDAAAALESALHIYHDLGHRLGQANALNYLGVVRRITGDYPGAAAALEQALVIYRDLGSRLGQANALTYLGVVQRITGNHPSAAAALDQALSIFRDLGDRGGEVEVLNEAGTLYLANGDLGQASHYHRQSLTLARVINSSWDEAHALAGLGRCALAAGDTTHGQDLLRQAQTILHNIGAAEAAEVATELTALRPLNPD